MAKEILLCGNWKMNFGPAETRAFLEKLSVPVHGKNRMRLYVPYLSLTAALEVVRARALPLEIGAQNVHFEKSGAFTGEISASMLKEIGIIQALVGHSERRQYFGETNESVMKRAASGLEQGLEILACIGETLTERNAEQTENVLRSQLEPLLSNSICKANFGGKLHLAYEPVWAIGTGVVATPAQAEAAHAFIRSMLVKALGPEQAQNTKILYGGSVQPQNFKELLACPNIEGGLVGGASLKLESWQALWDLG